MSLYSVVVPVYNSEHTLGELYTRLEKVFRETLKEDFELILVDDGSKDRSYEIMTELREKDHRVRIIQMARNFGQHPALLCGFAHVKGEFVVTMDDDLQHQPEELPKMVRTMQERPDVDVIIASYEGRKHGPIRKLGTKFSVWATSKMLGKDPDLQITSYRLIRRFLVDAMVKTNTYLPQIGNLLIRSSNRIINVPVQHADRAYGKSGYSFKRLLKDLIYDITTHTAFPLLLVRNIGIVSFLISVVLSVCYLVRYFTLGISVQGWTSLMLVMLAFFGLILLSIGIMGIYLMNILNEAKKNAPLCNTSGGYGRIMKEIGGYFQLEEMPGEEYYPDLYRVNLGRTALLWLLKSRRCRKILLPYFLCGSVVHTCQENQIETEFYHLNEKLEVLYLKEQLPEGEYLYLVNYYGQLSDSRISEYKKIYGNIIVDHTHAFFQKPLKGIDTLYSCRKFWGVSDGAYLSTDASLTENKTVDYSAERMKHILGRYEHNAGTYYKDMLENAAKYDGMELRQMSKLTQNLLKAVDYDRAKKKREENYRILGELLPSESIFNQTVPEGPFAYPYFHADGMKLRRYLAEKKIFVPTYWKNIIENSETKSLEYTWAANILPLPCDQRYSVEDMKYMASVVRECEERI